MATEPVFRVETYRLAANEFGGRAYKLHLRWTLSANYFVLIQWQIAGSGSFAIQDACVRVSEDPYGTGDLAVAGGNWLTLYRESSVAGATDVIVTVVECLRDEDGAGFRLRDVKVVTLADFAATGVQATTASITGTWRDANKVVLFGGRGGGGLSSAGATSVDDYQTAGTRCYPSGAQTININRYASANNKVELAECCVYAVEWGSEWTIQRVTVTGTNSGATLGLVGDYSVQSLGFTVARAQTWVWGCGYTDGSGPGDAACGQVYSLGNGVTQNAAENSVSCGSAMAVGIRNWEIYTLTHRRLDVGYQFKAMGAPGSYVYTISAPTVGADEGYTANALYQESVGPQRFALVSNGIANNATAEMGEAFYAAFLATPTTIQARTRDPAAGLNWAGWAWFVDFASITTVADALPAIRTSSYQIGAGVFTGTTYDLFLTYELSANYFVMIVGAESANATPDPDDISVYVSQDPFGTGDLAVSADSRTIRLARTASSQAWRGTITIVECLRGPTEAGFRLLDVRSIAIGAFADTGVQSVNAVTTAGVTWGDLGQVQLLTGWRGPGVQLVGPYAAGDAQSLGIAAIPAGSNTIQLYRYTNNAGKVKPINAVVYAVEWGSEWTVQPLLLMGAAGAAGAVGAGAYLTGYLDTPVDPTRSWVWASVIAEDDETQHSYLSGVVHLGDGAGASSAESRISVGLWTSDAFLAMVYCLTHPDLRTEWFFQGSTASGSVTWTAANPIRGEAYLKTSLDVVTGYRLGLAYTANGDGAATAWGGATLNPRHTALTTLTVSRVRTEGNWAGWLQSVDFGGLATAVGAVQVDDSTYSGPQSYLIFRDPNWSGSGSIASVTNEGGRTVGPVAPDSVNQGLVVGFAEGTPSADVELDLSLTGGGVGASGGYLYRLATETTAADWKALNALTALWRQCSTTSIGDPPTGKLYAQDVAYSAAYSRILLAYIATGDGTVHVDYQDASSPLTAWTAGIVALTGYELANTDTEAGLGMCELPDGAMLLAYEMVDTSSGYVNINLILSTDGGSNWTFKNRRILSKTTVGGRAGTGGQYLMRSSGDWVRLCFLQTQADYSANSLTTLISADRGASWAEGTALAVYSWMTATGFLGSAAVAMVGLGDASGTFLVAYQDAGGDTEVKFAIAARTDDWTEVTALAWDLAAYATTPRVKGLAFVRDPDRLWVFAWMEGANTNDFIVRVCLDPTDPENADSWTDFGRLSGFGGAMRYGPHCFRGAWAGNRIVLSGGLQDPDVAAAADPLVAGHWMIQSGSWDPQPWTYSLLDPYYNDPMLPQSDGHRVVGYQWIPCSGDPAGGGADSDANTPWTRGTAGVTTFTWNKTSERITTSDAAGTGYFELLPSTVQVRSRWGSGRHALHFRVKVSSTRQVVATATDVGVDVRALDSGGANGYLFTVRLSHLGVALHDNPAAAVVASAATTDFASECELRIAIRSGGLVTVSWRLRSAAPLGQWTQLAETAISSAALAAQRLRVGVLAAPGPAGTSTIDLYDIVTSYQTDAGQCDDVTKPTYLMGTYLDRGAILVANGIRVRWGGSGAFEDDGFTASLEYAHGVENLSLDSPRFYLESQDLDAWEAIFQASAASAHPRWHMNAMLLVGTVDRTATLSFSNTNSVAAWGAPPVSVELSADLYTDLTVVAVDGSSVQLEAASGDVFTPTRGEIIGMFIRFVASGSATGMTFRLTNNVHDDQWLHVADGVDLASLGVTVGAKAVIFGDRMVYLGAAFSRYRFFRVAFPDLSSVGSSLGTYTGTHRIGSMVPGFHQRMTVPIEWSFRDNEQPNQTETRTRGGATFYYDEGPPQRVVDGRLVGDVDQFRRSLRDMLREIHSYAKYPVGLVLTSERVSRETTVFGHVTSGSQMDEAAWYRDPSGEWRTAGDADLTVTEEV